MNIDLGYLGKAVLVPMEEPWLSYKECFKVVADGYTKDGIRVSAVVKDIGCTMNLPTVWRDCILIEVS